MDEQAMGGWFDFDAVIEPMGWGRSTYTVIRLPDDLVAAAVEAGTRRVEGLVDATDVNLAITRAPALDSPFVYAGRSLLRRLGVTAGAVVPVRLRPVAPDRVRVPEDLADALEQDALSAVFAALTPGERRAQVAAVEAATTAATRRRRVEELVERLRPGPTAAGQP